MTTTVRIEANGQQELLLLDYIKSLPFVKVVDETDNSERIPGLAYTREERLAALREAEEDYKAGRFITHEQMKAKRPRV